MNNKVAIYEITGLLKMNNNKTILKGVILTAGAALSLYTFTGCVFFLNSNEAISMKEEIKHNTVSGIVSVNNNILPAVDSDSSKNKDKKLFEMSPKEIDKLIGDLQKKEPDLRKRVMTLARMGIGQKYEIYLLGESPFEIFDAQPLFCLDKSDCVVFAEHIYAMALSHNWKEFFTMLQRIRYKDGVIGMLTRNHYTELDWDNNNSWLVNEITTEISPSTVKTKSVINKAAFFRKYNIGQDIQPQEIEWSYIPADKIKDCVSQLKTGDFINVVRGFDDNSLYVGHVGLIMNDGNGTVNMLHSSEPAVKEQTVLSYVEQSLKNNPKTKNGKKPTFYGLRFFRLNENAFENLKKIDGPLAPKVTIYGNDVK